MEIILKRDGDCIVDECLFCSPRNAWVTEETFIYNTISFTYIQVCSTITYHSTACGSICRPYLGKRRSNPFAALYPWSSMENTTQKYNAIVTQHLVNLISIVFLDLWVILANWLGLSKQFHRMVPQVYHGNVAILALCRKIAYKMIL
jgi:hypothetical protein